MPSESEPVERVGVGVADSRRHDLDQHLAGLGPVQVDLVNLSSTISSGAGSGRPKQCRDGGAGLHDSRMLGVEDAPRPKQPEASPPIKGYEVKALGREFWAVVAIGIVFTLARFSEAFLILRASGEGLRLALAPLVLVAMNAVYALGAYPAGALADRLPARTLLLWGLIVLVAADACLAAGGLKLVFAGILLWGGHMALTQGLLAKMIADAAPDRARGSAFGLFNLASGVALLLASLVAGLLWDQAGPRATFLAGGAFAALALLLALLPAVLRRRA
jgi:predicted MFS family arabinose efflux permease